MLAAGATLPPSLTLYASVAWRSFRRHSTYRAAAVSGTIFNTVVGVLKAFTFLAVFEQTGRVNGFDATDAVTFAFLIQALDAPIAVFHGLDLTARVRTGDVVTDLYRPVDFQAYWWATDLGRGLFQTIARGVPTLALGGLLFELRLPSSMSTIAVAVIAVVLAMVVSFAIRFLLALAAFWLVDTRGPQAVAHVFITFLSGWLVPFALFPDWLAAISRWLPFAAIAQFPAEVALGIHRSPADYLPVLAMQAGWALVFLGLGRVTLTAATKKVMVHGG